MKSEQELKKLIVKIANDYVRYKRSTYRSLAIKYGYGKTTIAAYLNDKLKEIDLDLYDKVQIKKLENIERTKILFAKMARKRKRKSFIKK